MNRIHKAKIAFVAALLPLLYSAVLPSAHAQDAENDADAQQQPRRAGALPESRWFALSPAPEQMVGDVRVRLTAMSWCRANQLDLPDDQYVERKDALGLAVRYEISGASQNGGKADTLTLAKIYGSSGAPNSAMSPQVAIAQRPDGGVLFWTGANPRWKNAALDMEFRPANQSENVEGKFQAPVEFEVPVPTQTDVAQPAKGQWKSVHGTQYLMRQVMVATKPFKMVGANFEWQPGFYFSIQREYPPDAPGSDAFRDLDEDRPEVTAVDANGGQTEVKVEVSMGGWVPADILATKKWDGIDSGVRSNNSKPLPPGTVSVRIRFIARESSDDWRDENALQKFHFALDLSRVPLPPVDADWQPMATVRGERLEVGLDQWRDVGKAVTARLNTRDLLHPDDARRLWLLRDSNLSLWNDYGPVAAKIIGHDDYKAMSGFQGVYHSVGPTQWWWRPNGAPNLGSSNTRDVTFAKPNGEADKIAAPLAIEGTWDEWLAIEHDWNLNDLPIPALGQAIIVNREIKGDGARLILRKLTAFDAEHPVAGIDTDFYSQVGHDDGIEATFEVLQTGIEGAHLDADTDRGQGKQGTQTLEWRDDKGRELRNFSYDPTGKKLWTATFTLPAKDAKSLSLHLILTEAARTGASETLTLRDVPAPTIPRRYDY